MNCSDTISQPPTWAAQATEEDDLDEPPELKLHHPKPQQFQRTAIRRASEQASLLTKAFKEHDHDEFREPPRSILSNGSSLRRRSMASTVSIASTADLTSDTGQTSPSRTNTPSPPIPEMSMLRLNRDGFRISPNAVAQSHAVEGQAQEPPKEAPRKRCIQFACAAKPPSDAPAKPIASDKVTVPQEPRRSCIRFACPPRPAERLNTPPRASEPTLASTSLPATESPSTPRKISALSAALAASPVTVRRLSNGPQVARPRFLRADSKDLAKDSSQFHEFASGISREDDWIRQDNNSTIRTKLTINDTLTKEINFRRLADEAEEEALLEEDDDKNDDDEDDEDEDEQDDGSEDEDEYDEDEDDEDEDDEDLDVRDGYSTDEETGFADSDDDEEDDNMILWTPSHGNGVGHSSGTHLARRPSAASQLSDCSTISNRTRKSGRRSKPRNIHSDHEAHDLPDSTDFVCGTLDEDRPLEEAYMSCLAARRNEKLRIIPQDIDPSFPTSDPENDDDDDDRRNGSEEASWMPAKMEDIHHEDRSRRRRKSEQASPRKYHSPPPKRRLSPAPKARGRSPKPLFDRRSPRRMRSPAHPTLTTPLQSPRQGGPVEFKLAGRPDVTHTKSLPRPAAMFRVKTHRAPKRQDDDTHVRGAVDIVKGLEKKRQRRKEKFYQKYCNKARRGQIPERKTQPGRGAERMKELGLLMAGKKDPGNYVLSV